MELIVRENLAEKFPDIKVAFLIVENLNNNAHIDKFESAKREFEDFIRSNYQDYETKSVINSYKQFYKKFGQKYPIQFQIKSLLEGKKLPGKMAVVEAMYMAEIKNMFLTAGHDYDKLEGNLTTELSVESSVYTRIDSKQQPLKADDIITSDDKDIISSVLYGPDQRTRITLETKNYMFFSYFPYGEDDERIRQHFMDIINYLKIFASEDMKYRSVQIFNL